MNETPLFKKAVALAKRGIPVFPCNSEKQPTTPNGLHDATTNANELWDKWQRYPGCLIGAVTGKASGYDVIDIDPRHNGDMWEDEHAEDLAGTFSYLTKSGGSHYWFKHVDGIRNSAGILAEGVDVRGDGGYVIVWPCSGTKMLCYDDARVMPEWIASTLLQSGPKHLNPGVSHKQCEGEGTPYGVAALERECEAILNAPDGGKHAVLNRAAFAIGGLVTAGELNEKYAMEALRRSVDGILSRCKDQNAAIRTLDLGFQQGMDQPRAVDHCEPLADIAEVPLIARLMAQAKTNEPCKSAPSPKYEFPNNLLEVDGFLADFIDHTLATARRPQPVAALAAGLSLVSVLAGRKYRTRTDLWSNIYAVTVIDSGGGKDHARKIIKDILSQSMMTKYLGGEEIASGSAIQTSLSSHPARLFLIDEAGDFFGSILSKKAGQHRQQIAQRLKTLYTSSASIMLGTEYADQGKQGRPRVDICNPIATIYGTTTPRQFWDAVAGASLEDGLMGRLLLFVPTQSYGEVRDPELRTIPDVLLDGAKGIAAGANRINPKNIANEMIADVPADPFTVPYALGAVHALKEIEAEQENLLREHADTYVTSLAARVVENAIKLALLRAISGNPSDPVITADYMRWGAQMSLHCYRTMLDGSRRFASENDSQANAKAVLECVRTCGGSATARDITRRMGMRLSRKDRDEALDTLVDGGWLTPVTLKPGGAGRPTIQYHVGDV